MIMIMEDRPNSAISCAHMNRFIDNGLLIVPPMFPLFPMIMYSTVTLRHSNSRAFEVIDCYSTPFVTCVCSVLGSRSPLIVDMTSVVSAIITSAFFARSLAQEPAAFAYGFKTCAGLRHQQPKSYVGTTCRIPTPNLSRSQELANSGKQKIRCSMRGRTCSRIALSMGMDILQDAVVEGCDGDLEESGSGVSGGVGSAAEDAEKQQVEEVEEVEDKVISAKSGPRLELKDKGGVSKDRLAFEMLGTREVDRLFSTLEPCDVTGFRHKPGSLLDATALIGGTAVGAGILALPAATLEAGVLPSSVGLILM